MQSRERDWIKMSGRSGSGAKDGMENEPVKPPVVEVDSAGL